MNRGKKRPQADHGPKAPNTEDISWWLNATMHGPLDEEIKRRQLELLDIELDQKKRQMQNSKGSQRSTFTQSSEYRSVTLNGANYTLTSRQAQMIGILHKAYQVGSPDVAIDYIMHELGASLSNWRDTWRDHEIRKALIRTGARKGTLRLNL